MFLVRVSTFFGWSYLCSLVFILRSWTFIIAISLYDFACFILRRSWTFYSLFLDLIFFVLELYILIFSFIFFTLGFLDFIIAISLYDFACFGLRLYSFSWLYIFVPGHLYSSFLCFIFFALGFLGLLLRFCYMISYVLFFGFLLYSWTLYSSFLSFIFWSWVLYSSLLGS